MFPPSVICRGGAGRGGARSPERGIDIGMEDLKGEDAELKGCDIIGRYPLDRFTPRTVTVSGVNMDNTLCALSKWSAITNSKTTRSKKDEAFEEYHKLACEDLLEFLGSFGGNGYRIH